MGDRNQLLFVRKHAEHLHGPYLEVGARDYGSTQDLEAVLGHEGEYVRADLQPGPRVDVVADLAAPFAEIDAALGGARFGTVFCLSVLEHCEQPFAMADNLTRLLAPGGSVVVSVPFAWRFHGYPSDYWRFTHEGVRRLFPGLAFDPARAAAATAREGEFRPIDEQLGKIPFSTRPHWREGRFVRGISARALRLLASLGPFRWLAGYRYVLAPTNLMMIGTRKEE